MKITQQIDPVPLEPTPNPPAQGESGLTRGRRPEWLRVKLNQNDDYWRLKQLMRDKTLHTVCEEALCPNLGECWGRGTATFLLLGDICTRSCRFCNVKTGRPLPLDEEEPLRVAQSVREMNLRHAVLTSVDRDDQPDGGAHIFANAIREIRRLQPGCTVEVLIPDFEGDRDALALVMDAHPEILNHNTETVPRLSKRVRPQARPERSLAVLRMAKELDPQALTKSGVMVGLGERWDELLQVMDDLRGVAVDILTIGQYLQPTRHHLPIERYYDPAEFEQLAEAAYARGFQWVESGPLVRSSYHADGQARIVTRRIEDDARFTRATQ
ncbi:MAG: lipoyl synthase [Chloroflexi bacterium HGW-Chloroflexi-1]|nr:MAG: lipoyl synthase [Chloroflexi bacterium HGW-Chloroflexi-1]